MTTSSVSIHQSHDSRQKRRFCCPGKKLINYSCKVWCMAIVCLLLLAAAVVLLYFLLNRQTQQKTPILALPKKVDYHPQCPTRTLDPAQRFDCYPDTRSVDRASCESRGCCYQGKVSQRDVNGTVDDDRIPVCIYPRNYGYVASGKVTQIANGFELPLKRIPAPTRYGDDMHKVRMAVEMQTKYRLRIKFYDPENYRYEVPAPKVPIHTSEQVPEQNAREIHLYSVTYDTHNQPFTIKVRRSSTDAIIFDTSAGALTLSNQFLELTTRLPSSSVFGLDPGGKTPFQHDFEWRSVSIFSKKVQEKGLPGVHPMYMCLENDGNVHGVLLLNSNAMEVFLHPSPAVTFRTIGGVLDFYLFLGPTAEDVAQQYLEAVGRPMIPPYWSLGLTIDLSAHESTTQVQNFVDRFKAKYIPVESYVVNQNIFSKFVPDNENFQNFSSLAAKLKDTKQRILLQLQASIPKREVMSRDSVLSGSLQNDIFVTDKWGVHPIEGKFDGKSTIYPNFGNPVTISWLSESLRRMNSTIEFDGLWLVNNEPASSVDGSMTGCLKDDLNQPPYVPVSIGLPLYQDTLCMDALLNWKEKAVAHYDHFNSYGHSMIVAAEQALLYNSPFERKLIVSDSMFVGSGHFAGHCIKSIESSWEGLHSSLKVVLQLGLHGITLSGTNICGGIESDQKSEELCLRWLQLAIFYPLLHLNGLQAEYLYKEGLKDRDIFHAIRSAISRRYELLPQLYTLFYHAHTKGLAIMRPLFYVYPDDIEAYNITSQFMWGDSLLVAPILEEGIKKLSFYLPEGIWYDFYQGTPVYSSGEWFTEMHGIFDDSKQPAAVYIKAGHIVTLQKPSETIHISRENSMSILIALNSNYEASGMLYWDDGKTKNSVSSGEYLLVDYFTANDTLIVSGHFGRKVLKSSFYKAAIEQVRIMGLSKPPKRIIIDKNYILSNKQYKWNIDTMALDLKHILIPLERRTEIKWVF